MDYGIAKALSGFVSSGDAKQQRNQDFALLQNLYAQQQQQLNQEAKLNQDMVAYQEKVTELATQITSGTGMREEDRNAYKMLTEEATQLLKEDIAKSGSIAKFLQSGGAQKLADYKNVITGSDIAQRLQRNQLAFEKMIDASQGENSDQTAHLIPESFMQQVQMYQNGQIDEVQWQGLLSDYDWDIKDEMQKDQMLTPEMILGHGMNYQIAVENFKRDRGYTPDMFETPEDYDYALKEYVESKYGAVYGTQEISTTLSSELNKVKYVMQDLADQGFKYENSYVIDDAGNTGTFKDAFENSEGMVILDKTLGYDAGWSAHTYKGNKVRTTGSWGMAYESDIASILYGDDYDVETGTLKVDALKVEDGVFIGGTGGKLGAGHDVGTWFGEGATNVGDGDALILKGYTIGLKVSGTNANGEYEEYLITDQDDPKYDDLSDHEGKTVKQVYLAEFYDIDQFLWLNEGAKSVDADMWYGDFGILADDVYYHEINFDKVKNEMDKKLDINSQLTEQRKNMFQYDKKVQFEKQKQKRKNKIQKDFLKEYVNNAPEYDQDGVPTVDKIKKKFIPTFDNQLFNLVGPDNDGEFTNLRPHLFSFVLSEAKKRNPNDIGSETTRIINSLTEYKGTEFGEVIKGGNVNNFYQWLNNNGFNTKDLRKEARNLQYVIF